MDSYDEKDVPGGEEQAGRPGPDAADGGQQAAPGAAAPAPTSEDVTGVTPPGASDAPASASRTSDALAFGTSNTPVSGTSNPPAPAPGAPAAASADLAAAAGSTGSTGSAGSTGPTAPEHPAPGVLGAPAGQGDQSAPGVPGRGIAGLSLPYQVAAALALAVVAVVAVVHIAMVFLHVAPSNTVTKQHGKVVDDWIYPEFEQNWKLFAPNPLQQNIAVQARAEIRMPDGNRKTTGWIDLSAGDGSGIRGNPLPSHSQQNELRRGWEFFINSHTDDNKPNGLRGELSDRYIHRIVMLRLGARRDGGTVERVQVRSVTTSVKAPPWSDEKIDTRPYYRVVPWWTVTPADLPGGAGTADARTEAAR
ncbi:DUF5819 family protein [Streptomyces sp. NPDC058301]|uniref:DUF5819 family protein n=1 Tax=Streptomyces sp. NPDC058301 TaxID=3346436 RepID=UPI0036EDC5B1